MTVLVESYELRESNRSKIPLCHECDFPPAWEIRQQMDRGSVGYACPQHVDQVLFLVDRGRIPAKTKDEE